MGLFDFDSSTGVGKICSWYFIPVWSHISRCRGRNVQALTVSPSTLIKETDDVFVNIYLQQVTTKEDEKTDYDFPIINKKYL